MNFFVFLQHAEEIAFIAAEVTVLYTVIPFWRKRRLRFALLLASACALGLLATVCALWFHQIGMSEELTSFVSGVVLVMSMGSMVLYGIGIVQLGRYLSATAASDNGERKAPETTP